MVNQIRYAFEEQVGLKVHFIRMLLSHPIPFSSPDDILKPIDPRLIRPIRGNLKEYLLKLREPPLAPLKGTGASLCKAFADSFDHALYGYKVVYKHLNYTASLFCKFAKGGHFQLMKCIKY